MKPNYILDIPAEQYHKDAREGKYLSSHLLGDFRKCPKLYHDKMTGAIERTETAALAFGQAAHMFTLEGAAAFSQAYMSDALAPVNEKTGEKYGKLTKAYKDWAAKQDKKILSQDDLDLLVAIRNAVHSHPIAGMILRKGFAEGTIRTIYEGAPCQIRMDWFDPERGILGDLKTTDDLDFLEADIRKYGYIHQLAFYKDVAEAAGAKINEVYIIGVEKKGAYRSGVWMIENEALERAAEENRAAIRRIQEAKALGNWETGYEDLRVIGFKD